MTEAEETPEEQIAQLKRQLTETRRSAVSLLSSVLAGLVTAPRARLEVAGALDEVAESPEANEEMAHIARLVAEAIRQEGEQNG